MPSNRSTATVISQRSVLVPSFTPPRMRVTVARACTFAIGLHGFIHVLTVACSTKIIEGGLCVQMIQA